MIHSLSRFSKNLLEGFTGVYIRPDGGSVSFSLCLNPENAQGKNAKELKRQTLIEARYRAGAEVSPQVYAMTANLKNADLSAGIKYALQSGEASVPVFIEVPNKASFANACEALGMSRKTLIELAGSSFVADPQISQQAHGKFHRVLGDIYDKGHLPITLFEDMYGASLRMTDPQSYDYATSVSDDIRNALPGAQKYVLQYNNNVSLNHMDGEMGRYYKPQNITAIEVRVKVGEGIEATEVGYMFMLFPPQFTQGANDFDVCLLIEHEKAYGLCPVMISIAPNERLNNVSVEYRPFVNENQIKAINEATSNSFNNMCDHATFVILSALEWINSPNAQRVDHQPKQKQSSQSIAAQFAAGGKRPFFSSVEVKIPDMQQAIIPLHREQSAGGSVGSFMGLQSVSAHWQHYGKDKELRFKGAYERGNPAYGVSAHIGVGGTEPK